jgi:ribosome recycling factor
MSDELKKISTEAENGMKKAINHLDIELSKIRAGKASPSISSPMIRRDLFSLATASRIGIKSCRFDIFLFVIKIYEKLSLS